MNWVKKNKLSTFLLIIITLFFLKNIIPSFFGINQYSLNIPRSVSYEKSSMGSGTIINPSLKTGSYGSTNYYRQEYTPTDIQNRLIVQETSLSMVVLKVRETVDKIIDQAKSAGGYMVNSSLSQPEEAPSATIVIRVPFEKLRDTLDYLRTLAVKVTYENVVGTDVTDEYVDIEARLATLQATKTKFESILNQANEVQDILTVQREIISLQDQIDSLKGRQKYLEQTAELSKITIYLSSDEFALPYAPSESFKPATIFKLAVRSLVRALRSVATLVIWIVVYSIIWLPVVGIVFFVKKIISKKKQLPVN